MAQFQDFELAAGASVAEQNLGVGSVIGGFLDATDFELVPVFSAGAWPSGPIESETMAELFERARSELTRAGELDGVLLNLHGADRKSTRLNSSHVAISYAVFC